MTDKNKKTILLNTLILCFCVIVIALFCFIPQKNLQDGPNEIYTINFDSDGGTAIAAIEIKQGSGIELPEEPTREGYIFVGWMLDDEPYDFSDPVDGDITLTASWKKIEEDKKYYVITFNTDGGTYIANQVLEEGETVSRPINPTKEGFDFVEWQYNGSAYDFDQKVTSDIEITATYKEQERQQEPETTDDPTPTYRVTFNLNGGTAGGNCNAQTVRENQTARNTCTPTRNNYTFAGWDKAITTQIKSNTTFTARWNENPRYTISFNSEGNQTCNPITNYTGTKVNLMSCTYQKPHYTFDGWRFGGQTYRGTYTIVESLTFSPVFTKKEYYFTAVEKTDGLTSGGYDVSFSGLDGTIKQISICSGNLCFKNLKAPTGNVNNKIYIESMTSCTVEFTDSSEKFTCRRR